jgi:glycine/D-amino acid oxidase-like deaminating enzyme
VRERIHVEVGAVLGLEQGGETMSSIQERCWWLREAMARPEFAGAPAPALRGDTDADVLIIGGGYTGLWTAWQLKQADPGLDVVLLEQDECGFGPSGRNGGFINGYYDHAETLVELFGVEGARAIIAAGAQTVREMAAWMDEHAVDAWLTRNGYIGVASSAAQDGAWRGVMATAETIGIGGKYRELSAAEVAGFACSPVFRGGYFVADGGNLQPARLARGLRRVCMEAGVRLYEHTPVSAFRAGPPAVARTPGGVVRAPQAVLAVGAWAGGWRQFRRRIVTRASFMAITAPAPDRLAEIGWTSGVAIYDMRVTLRYLRTTPDGRIALGVGGERGAWNGRIDDRVAWEEAGTRHAIEAIHRFFPSFRTVPIEGRWGGPIDVAGTHTPYAGTLPGGHVHYALGYTGNGVAPSHLFGKILAARVRGVENELTRLPFVDMEPKRFPPEPLRSLGAALANEAMVRRDDAHDAGRRPNPLVDFVARLPRRLGYQLGP